MPPNIGSPSTGQIRPYEADDTVDGQPAKRQRIEKLPMGQLYAVSAKWLCSMTEELTD